MQSSYQSRPAMAVCIATALALHAMVLFGLGFSLEPQKAPTPTLEITLATFATENTPDKTDYLAQDNQQGSGTLDKEARPSSDLPASFQDNKLKAVQLQEQSLALPQQTASTAEAITSLSSEQEKSFSVTNQEEIITPQEEHPREQVQFSSEIASLEADFNQLRQAYAKRPVVHRINTASTRKADVQYQEVWRRKVMRIGQTNYPTVARQNKIYGELRLVVQIERDGSLKNIEIIRSSGHKILDDAAVRIVRMAAPYAPFPPELREYDLIEIIRTWRFEPGDLFSG